MEEKIIVINSDISDPRKMANTVYNTRVSLKDIQKGKIDWNIKGYPKDQVIADLKNILNLLEKCGIKKPHIFGSIYIQAQNKNSPVYISDIELRFWISTEKNIKICIIFFASYKDPFWLYFRAFNKGTGKITECGYRTAPSFSEFVDKFNEWLGED